MSFKSTRSGKKYFSPAMKDKQKCISSRKPLYEKSARKRLDLLGPPTDLETNTITDELVLQQIFSLSPVTPVKQCKEGITPKPNACRELLSPLRSLNVVTPPHKRCESLQVKRNEPHLPRKNSCKIEPVSSLVRHIGSHDSNIQPIRHKTSPAVSLLKENTCAFEDIIAQVNSGSVFSPTKKLKMTGVTQAPVKRKTVRYKRIRKSIVNSPDKENISCSTIPSWKHPNKGDTIYSKVKNALHNSVPNHMIGRDPEMSEIAAFINDHATSNRSGSLYMSGAPGTGKSACLMHVLASAEVSKKVSKIITVNCMSMRTASQIYQRIATNMGAEGKQLASTSKALKYIEAKLTEDKQPVLLFLDEIDQLDSKNQEVLYTMFGWSLLPNSRIILIGIANSLDLTDRILPRLHARVRCKPKLINFKPYSREQLVQILQDRISMASAKASTTGIIDGMAIQFCARKVAAMTGDARKALDICRRAVEMVESNNSPFEDSQATFQKVGMTQICAVISGVYESNQICKQSSKEDGDCDDAFPLQQKLIVCTLLLLCKNTGSKDAALGKLHEAYSVVCKKQHLPAVCQSEFFSLCELVESRGIISIKKAKQCRQTKLRLNVQENDIEYSLQGKALLSSILQTSLDLSR